MKKRIDENRMTKSVLENELTSVERLSRPHKSVIDDVRKILRYMNGTVKQAEEILYGRSAWRSFVWDVLEALFSGKNPEIDEMPQHQSTFVMTCINTN